MFRLHPIYISLWCFQPSKGLFRKHYWGRRLFNLCRRNLGAPSEDWQKLGIPPSEGWQNLGTPHIKCLKTPLYVFYCHTWAISVFLINSIWQNLGVSLWKICKIRVPPLRQMAKSGCPLKSLHPPNNVFWMVLNVYTEPRH